MFQSARFHQHACPAVTHCTCICYPVQVDEIYLPIQRNQAFIIKWYSKSRGVFESVLGQKEDTKKKRWEKVHEEWWEKGVGDSMGRRLVHINLIVMTLWCYFQPLSMPCRSLLIICIKHPTPLLLPQTGAADSQPRL